MLNILRAYDVLDRAVKPIGHMYEHTIAHVSSPDEVTDDFPIQAGVLQGDTLVPFLFIVVLDYVFTYMDFADDIALLADCQKDTELLQLLESNA